MKSLKLKGEFTLFYWGFIVHHYWFCSFYVSLCDRSTSKLYCSTDEEAVTESIPYYREDKEIN